MWHELSARCRLSAWRESVARAVVRARRGGEPVLAVGATALREAPDPLELFDAAERRGETRFLLVHPEEDFALVGLGRSAGLDGPLDPARASAAIGAWLDGESGLAAAEPLFLAGAAFARRLPEAR